MPVNRSRTNPSPPRRPDVSPEKATIPFPFARCHWKAMLSPASARLPTTVAVAMAFFRNPPRLLSAAALLIDRTPIGGGRPSGERPQVGTSRDRNRFGTARAAGASYVRAIEDGGDR